VLTVTNSANSFSVRAVRILPVRAVSVALALDLNDC